MHKPMPELLQAQFAQGELDLETYWSQVAQPRFAELVVPLTPKDAERLQKGLARVAQKHMAAMQYHAAVALPEAASGRDAAMQAAQSQLQRTLGYGDAE